MISTLLLASTMALTPAAGPAPLCLDAAPTAAEETLRALYARGRTFDQFLADARRRKALWLANYQRAASIDAALLERARSVQGSWRLLVVTVDGCSDSASTIPYLARLVEQADNLEMRIIDPADGRDIMESHRTPDGRAATPTVLILDGDWNEAGSFIERPAALQTWILDRRDRLSEDEIYRSKMDWYAEDAGRRTVEELVGLLEAAVAGAP